MKIKTYTSEEIKNRLLNIGEAIGQIAFDYIVELEKENAELDYQMNRNKYCYSCANVTDRCFRNEIGCPCAKYKSYKDENAELKAFKQDCIKLTEDNVVMAKQRGETVIQLTKAKELIKELSFSLSVVGECEEEECELLNRAEQFLKDSKEGKQMRVYISGAITGVKHADKLFAKAEEKLELEGYEVVNPYKFGEQLKKEYEKENKFPKYENYMRVDIALLINCDAIYLLNNWGTSKGARLEKKIAEVLKMQIMTE